MERQIIIGLISDVDYVKQIRLYWNPEYIESSALHLLATWCIEYFDKHDEVPGGLIENIFEKKRKRIDKDLAEELEEEILPSLSNEYYDEKKNTKYLLDETEKYFISRSLAIKAETISALLAKDDIKQAAEVEESFDLFKGFAKDDEDTKPESEDFDKKIDEVFEEANEPVFKYHGALGKMLNEHLIRGGFVGILAPEKRYKSWILLDMAMRAYEQGVPVAFFQAGDMTENQQLLRLFSYIAKQPTKEELKEFIYVPVVDCVKNQNNTCSEGIRECFVGITNKTDMELRGPEKLTRKELIDAYENNPDYKRCINCTAFSKNMWGTLFVKKIKPAKPLTKKRTKTIARKFFSNENLFRMRTFANGTLTINMMNAILDQWELIGFKPKFIAIDYADLIVDFSSKEYRHQQNKIWKDLRALSQKRNALIVAPTQADANSYEVATLKLKNFSEDKRKYAHVTAMFGLNHDKDGVEKALGMLRINKLIVREGVNEQEQVHVTQRLDIGRPIFDSFF